MADPLKFANREAAYMLSDQLRILLILSFTVGDLGGGGDGGGGGRGKGGKGGGL
jgi:hypothetical protein